MTSVPWLNPPASTFSPLDTEVAQTQLVIVGFPELDAAGVCSRWEETIISLVLHPEQAMLLR